MRGASARPFNPRAFIRDAISAPVWYRPSRAPQTPPVHPCTGGSLYQNLNNEKTKNRKIENIFGLFIFVVFFMLKECILEPPAGMLVAG
ncbi:hypothetical protein PU00_12645 [Hafnia alvei]|nr:hypothetical protein PU00_12645 [Hafnia alvei]